MGEKTKRRSKATTRRAIKKPRFGGVFLFSTDERYKVATDDVPYICGSGLPGLELVTRRKITKKCRWLEGCSQHIVAMRTHQLIAPGDRLAFAAEVVRYGFLAPILLSKSIGRLASFYPVIRRPRLSW
jgi:hypothetical protein